MIKLSVIIPTRNPAETLERGLISIARQTLPKNEFEVIVVIATVRRIMTQ